MGGTPLGEANRLFCIFTRDLGMIYGSAQGVRNISSKLRYSLQDFSFSEISMVKGKNLWKVTNAAALDNFYLSLRDEPEKLRLFSRVFSLLKKLLAGEEKNDKLYGLLLGAVGFLCDSGEMKPADLKNFECILVLRILRNLGYLRESRKFEEFVESGEWDGKILGKLSPVRAEAVEEINKALAGSHLVR